MELERDNADPCSKGEGRRGRSQEWENTGEGGAVGPEWDILDGREGDVERGRRR